MVDDALIMRTHLKMLLRQLGHTVAEASDGYEAVACYLRCEPDLVIMDIVMPRLNGLDALRAICFHDPEARIIMLSSLGQQSVWAEAIHAGAKEFLVKPVSLEVLQAAVTRWGKNHTGRAWL